MTSLPNISHIPTRLAFHQALLGFCKSYNSGSCPLIIVHSDAGSGGKAEASWMDRESGDSQSVLDVVGREVLDGPWSAEIKYVPRTMSELTVASVPWPLLSSPRH